MLSQKKEVRDFLEASGFKNPEALTKHLERMEEAESNGVGSVRYGPSLRSSSPQFQEIMEMDIAEAQDEAEERRRLKGGVKAKESSEVSQVDFKEGVLDFISGFIASREIMLEKPDLVGLFEETLKAYHNTLDDPLGTMLHEKLFDEEEPETEVNATDTKQSRRKSRGRGRSASAEELPKEGES